MFAEAIAAILEHRCTPPAVRGIERGASSYPLATALAESGFLDLLAPEDQGGGGASWRDFFDVVLLCGSFAVPLPLVQTMAARLLYTDARAIPAGYITFAPCLAQGADGSLRALHVPFARTASHVIGALDDSLVVLRTSDAHVLPSGIHGSLASSLHWPAGCDRVIQGCVRASELSPMAALLYAGLLAGAMKRCFDLTMGYANERVQFGKPIGKFQAIQHQLSVMAEHVAAGQMAAESAFGAAGRWPSVPACAVAKARTSEAAQLVAATAHAVHGAIGVTEEYDLQLFTRRLHEWRIAHGSEAHWHRALGRLLVESSHALSVDFARTILERAPE